MSQLHVLLKTKDSKEYVVLRRSIKLLKEFIREFGIKTSLIKLKKGQVLGLEELSKKFCDHLAEKIEYDYQVVEENVDPNNVLKKRKS